jgi:hypothetical protein
VDSLNNHENIDDLFAEQKILDEPADAPDLKLDPNEADPSESAGTAMAVAGKKGKKGKVDVLPADPLSSCAHQVENLKADAARAEVYNLIAGTEFDLFKLGGVLAVVHEKEYWAEYGFQDFRTFLETEHGLQYRKAMYLISIYYGVIEHQLTWAQVQGLGWTKLKVILNPHNKDIVTAANIGAWLEKAKNMTVLQLESAIAGALKGPGENATEQDSGKTITTMTFKLHEDQKDTVRAALEKAKEVGGTQVDTVALEMMALEFLNKPMAAQTETPPPSLLTIMQEVGWEGVLNEFAKLWPDIELTVELPGAGE